MKKIIALFTLSAFVCIAARASYVPVTVTGFNEDVVANGAGSPANSVSANLLTMYNGMDNQADVLTAQDYIDPQDGPPQYYLPTGGLLASALTNGLTFQLASYTSNNDLLLATAGDNGTLSFATPQSAATVYLCGFSAGNAPSEFDVQVNFSDGSSQTFANNMFDDWTFTTYAASVPGIGEASIDGGLGYNISAQFPRMYELALNLDAANTTKIITGITVTKTEPSTSYSGYLSIMAVSVNTTSCSGAPTAGTVVASQSQGCQPFVSTLTLSGSDNSGGITYQWQSSGDGINWANVDQATANNYIAYVFSPIYYREAVTCINGNVTSETPAFQFTSTSPVPVPAALPYFQGFENWIGTCYIYDRPDNSWILDPISSDNSWRRDDQGFDAGWNSPSQDGAYTPASSEGSHSARFHAALSNNENGSMNLYANFSAAGTKSISFDYINFDSHPTGGSQLVVSISPDSGATWTVIGTVGSNVLNWTKETFITNAVSPHAIIQFTGEAQFPYADLGIDSLNVTMLPDCSGTPDAGTIGASQLSGCSEYVSVLTSTVGITTGGFAFQWSSSTDGTNYTPLNGATSYLYNADVTATTYYELTITCIASGQSVTTAPVQLQLLTPQPTYATLPYFQGFESWIGTCSNYDRPDNSWTTWPESGSSSWRRDDQGLDAGWTFINAGTYTPASTEGAHSARFHNLNADNGTLNLYADFSNTGTKKIMFDYINAGSAGENSFSVSISTDSGITWTQLGSYGTGVTSWTPEMLITNIIAPHVIIQFQATASFGAGDIGIDSVYVSLLPGCNGTPVAGSTNTTQLSGCSAFTPILSVNIGTTTSGLTFQWYQSADGTTYTPINGATNSSYQPDITQSTYFYCTVTCTASGQTDNSTAIEELLATPQPVYASLPYFQGFENWIGACYNYDRPDNSWTNNTAYGDESWRRNDQGSDAGWNDPTNGMYTPASTEGNHSARFHSSDAGNNQGEMDMYINLGGAGTKTISFDYINTDQNGSTLAVSISTNNGNTWAQLGLYGDNVNDWEAKTISTTATGNAIIQFLATPNHGNGDIGLDSVNVILAPGCSGMPAAGTFTNTETTSCLPFFDTMTIDNPVYATGIAYQWQSSTDGIIWSDVSGATNVSYDMPALVTSNIYYRYRVVCTNSSDTAYSTSTELHYTPEVVTTATLPYFQSFESWVGGTCYMYDRPDNSWIDSPNVGNSSIRKYNQGIDAQWDYITNGTYFPVSTDGSYSARFHQSQVQNGQPGIMDLHIDLSPAGAKQITFDAINSISSDLIVSLSENNGATWTNLGTATPSSDWLHQAFITNSVAPNAIIRITFSPDNFNPNDVGIDSFYVHVLPTCNGAPVAGTFSATQTTGCVAYVSDLSVDVPIAMTGISYQWQSSADNSTWGDVSGATNSTYEVNVSATIYYRFIVTCLTSGDRDTSNAAELQLAPESTYVATLPYFQGFENWTGTCAPTDRPDSNWSQEYISGNQAWARDDQGANAGWNDPFGGSYFPSSMEGNHSASFDSYDDGGVYGNDDGGSLLLHINLSPASTKTITFYYHNDFGIDYLNIDLSEDGGNTWTTLDTIKSGDFTGITGWTPESITTNSVSPNAIIRLNAFGDYSDNIGVDSFYITAPICNALTNVQVTGVTSTMATGTWDAVSGTAGYEVVINNTVADPTTGLSTAINSYIANGLQPGNTYYLHVRDSCGPGLFSSWTTISFTTTAGGCDTISGLAVNNVSGTGATITWNTISGATGYEYVISTIPTAPSTGTATTNTSVSPNNLTPGILYYVFVRDSCGPNNFSAWDTISFTTIGGGCDTISGLAVNNVSGTGATITWNAISGAAGYEYVISTISTAPSTGTVTTNTSVSPNNLTPGILYYVFVRDSCGPNSFSAWDTITFSTLNEGIASVNGNFDVAAYPNPTKNIVTVKAYGQMGNNRKVSLTDVAGRVIDEEDMTANRVDFNMNNLASGIYLIRYEDNSHTRMIRVSKE